MTQSNRQTVMVVATNGEKKPLKAHADDAAFDLEASNEQPIMIPCGETRVVPTGLKIALPTQTCALVLSRSGLAANQGIIVANSPGLIDPGYTGEIKVILYNTGNAPYYVHKGVRIAQLLFMPLPSVVFVPLGEAMYAEATQTVERGEDGLGSTGMTKFDKNVAEAAAELDAERPGWADSIDEETRRVGPLSIIPPDRPHNVDDPALD